MPRQRIRYRKTFHVFPSDFPRRLELFKEASSLTWREIARRLGTNTLTLRRWRAGAQPNSKHLLALLEVADELSLGHLFPVGRARQKPEPRAPSSSPAKPNATAAPVIAAGPTITTM